ncbi:glycogen/starch/alpha-glucan family phosphorylase [bacterium]|nr:glycogen/starch/alpha-glucan family phosphorylase [bacterium]
MMAQQVKHYIISMMGKTFQEATDGEIYRALAFVLREQVMVHWAAAAHTFSMEKARKVYYLSLEWLPGRISLNNIINISNIDLVREVLNHLGKDFQQILVTEPEPGLGNGGLGRLAACFLDSLATHHYPVMGYGLRYQYGIFEQSLWAGVQIERSDRWLLNEYPWELRRDSWATTVEYHGSLIEKKNKHDEMVHNLANHQDVRTVPYDIPIVGFGGDDDYSALTLRLWTTKESPANFSIESFNDGDIADAVINTSLTDVLYPNDKNMLGFIMRIKQEFLLVSASLQDIIRQHMDVYQTMDNFRDKVRIQINDTHPALIIAELIRIFTKDHEHKFGEALEIVQEVCSYTNHTVLRESLEVWDQEHIKEILPAQFHIIERLNQMFCDKVRSTYPNDEEKVRRMSIIEEGRIKMANLAIVGSHKVNGVAALHTEIIKEKLFADFTEMMPDKFVNVTNGVTQRRWLYKCNPGLSALLIDCIGMGWITDLSQLEKLKEHIDKEEVWQRFLQIKKDNKERLVRTLECFMQEKGHTEEEIKNELFFDNEALFDVQIKRIHEYKRQLMNCMHIIVLYNRLKNDPSSVKIKRKIVIGGKAAPGYEMAKNIIRLIYILSRKIHGNEHIREKLKVAYIENYNVSKAEIIIPAADLSEQISTASMEASGTGNMKLSMNGALTIGTDDGANVEMREAVGDEHWPFLFGYSSDEVNKISQEGTHDPDKILQEHAEVREAMERLRDGSLVENEAEDKVLKDIYDSLMVGENRDRYLVLGDLPGYIAAQDRVADLYQDKEKWAKMCLWNIASMGTFSSDVSVKNYAEKIWNIKPCPINKEELKRIRTEFEESDRCYVSD